MNPVNSQFELEFQYNINTSQVWSNKWLPLDVSDLHDHTQEIK